MKELKNPILIVQGGAYGSEAKGAVAHALCKRLKIDWAVRTGSINAGHSVIRDDGSKIAYQQLPVAAALPDINLVIGPGAYVHIPTMLKELSETVSTPEKSNRDRLFIDHNCGIHLDSYTDEAKLAGRNLKIGATGKGCAEAIIAKIRDRGVGKPLLLREHWDGDKHGKLVTNDTAKILTQAYHDGDKIMLEGTQGTLLDMHCGPYPFTTSRQTTSAAWVAEAGLSPSLQYEVCLVVRTFPIRVAGNSGPMGGREIDWPHLARQMNLRLVNNGLDPVVPEPILRTYEKKLAEFTFLRREKGQSDSEISLMSATDVIMSLDESSRSQLLNLFETTTVTKRLRRITELDVEQLKMTAFKENAAYIALTFLNYVFPELHPQHNTRRLLHDEALRYVEDLQRQVNCWIRYVSIGPKAEDLLEVDVASKHTRHWLTGKS